MTKGTQLVSAQSYYYNISDQEGMAVYCLCCTGETTCRYRQDEHRNYRGNPHSPPPEAHEPPKAVKEHRTQHALPSEVVVLHTSQTFTLYGTAKGHYIKV